MMISRPVEKLRGGWKESSRFAGCFDVHDLEACDHERGQKVSDHGTWWKEPER